LLVTKTPGKSVEAVASFALLNADPTDSRSAKIPYTVRVLVRDLPPGEKWRKFELKALGLRDFAQVKIDLPLNPFELARFANLVVIKIEQLESLSEAAREHLLGPAAEEWSGGACSLPDGSKLVILNPTHGPARTNATLMEEICHVFLGHEPNKLSIVTKDDRGKVRSREYRQHDEEEAYGVGAACLVPYTSLKNLLHLGKSSKQIAAHFRVSRELVEYRMKVTRLWGEFKQQGG
jgi:hypothetical protein